MEDIKIQGQSFFPTNSLHSQAVQSVDKKQTAQKEKESKEQDPSDQQLKEAVGRVNTSLKLKNTELEVAINKEANRKVAVIRNQTTNEVIREIPSKDFIEWEAEYSRLLGILFDKRV
jgi:flagellar protein FlaG